MATASTYKVNSGDTLSKIASSNGTTVAALAKMNNITDVNKIAAGQILNLAPAPTLSFAPTSSSPSIFSGASTQTQTSTPATINLPKPIPVSTLGKPVNAPIVKPVTNSAPHDDLGVVANTTVNNANTKATPQQVATVSVLKSVDNADGTTTNFLSDGTTDTGKLEKQADGTYKFTPISSTPASGKNPADTTIDQPVTTIDQVTDSKSLGSFLKTLIGQQAGKGDFTEQARKDNQIDEKTAALTELNNKALLTKKSYDDQINALKDNNSEGAFGGGLEIKVNDLTRKANQDLANIGILQLVAQNNLEGAQKIVDAKVAAKFEPITAEIQALSQLNSVMQNDMSESEQFAANKALDEKKAKAAGLQSAYATALKTAVDNGAPQSILQAIDRVVSNPNATPAMLYSALGKYGQNALEIQAKQASINASNRSNQGESNTFGALSKADKTTGLNWLLNNGGTKDDQAKFASDRAFQAWVMGQAN